MHFSWTWLIPALCWGIVQWWWTRSANRSERPLWPDGDPTAPGWYRDSRATAQRSWEPWWGSWRRPH